MTTRPLEDCSPIYEGVHELTVVEKIWSIIIDVIAIVAEIFTIDENELMEQNYTERPQAQGHATDRSDCLNPKSETLEYIYSPSAEKPELAQ